MVNALSTASNRHAADQHPFAAPEQASQAGDLLTLRPHALFEALRRSAAGSRGVSEGPFRHDCCCQVVAELGRGDALRPAIVYASRQAAWRWMCHARWWWPLEARKVPGAAVI